MESHEKEYFRKLFNQDFSEEEFNMLSNFFNAMQFLKRQKLLRNRLIIKEKE